eukprot:TRINITY_DN13703_c0_g3_i1.p1 TRINITY_DN13703_c0_g3~~TRINITY_DN13703_c0_g3_i1.p1  ORF type:complete len:702 (+),score=131.41 TRINITY_DN13703_c0_g3_i1:36-2141(+)
MSSMSPSNIAGTAFTGCSREERPDDSAWVVSHALQVFPTVARDLSSDKVNSEEFEQEENTASEQVRPAHDEGTVTVSCQTFGSSHLGNVQASSHWTLHRLKDEVSAMLKDSGRVATSLLFDEEPLTDLDRTLDSTFSGETKVEIKVFMTAITPKPEEASSEPRLPVLQRATSTPKWLELQECAVKELCHGEADNHNALPVENLPDLSQLELKLEFERTLKERGYALPGLGLRNLGGGSFGRVMLICRDGERECLFALKRQPLGRFDLTSLPVLREITILHAFKGHPNIIQITAAFLESPAQSPEAWAVLEYLPRDLHTAVEERPWRYAREADAKEVAWQVLQGLAALHSRDVVHRDLKPGNLLIDEGPPLRVVLCDFGLARSVHAFASNLSTAGGYSTAPHQAPLQKCDTPPISPDVPSSSDDEELAPTPPSLPKLQRTFTVHISTACYRAPEMWGFASTRLMTKRDFKSIDIYALGLIWSLMLTNQRIVTHSDTEHPAEFLLLEVLKKVDAPSLEDVRRLGFTDEACTFIERVLNDDLDDIRQRWQLWPVTGYEMHRNAVIEMPRIPISEWIQDKREAMDDDWNLLSASSEVLRLISCASKFCYSERPSAADLLQEGYFADLAPASAVARNPNTAEDSVPCVIDATEFIGNELKRLGDLVDMREKKEDLQQIGSEAMIREQTAQDVARVCEQVRGCLKGR